MKNSEPADNRTRILDAARALLQSRGFNAFSHRDLAAIVGIKSSSVHYYFPSKEALGIALIEDYTQALRQFFSVLEAEQAQSPEDRIRAFCQLFEETAKSGDKVCLAGMLASDFQTLGEPLQQALRQFFSTVEGWLSIQMLALNPRLELAEVQKLARLAISLLEGALLAARVWQEPERVAQAEALICHLVRPPQAFEMVAAT